MGSPFCRTVRYDPADSHWRGLVHRNVYTSVDGAVRGPASWALCHERRISARWNRRGCNDHLEVGQAPEWSSWCIDMREARAADANAEFDQLLESYPDSVRDLALRARRLILEVGPMLTEMVDAKA